MCDRRTGIKGRGGGGVIGYIDVVNREFEYHIYVYVHTYYILAVSMLTYIISSREAV